MLVAIDIGNSSTKFGVFDGEQLLEKFQIATVRNASIEEFSSAIGTSLTINPDRVIVSSVVPELHGVVSDFFSLRFGVQAVFLDHNFPFPMKVSYETPATLGIDRLVAAFAAREKYGAPLIVCDFGTATTIDAVSEKNEYLGGIITPGMNTLAESLRLRTSKLPLIEIGKPESVIGKSTVDSIKSGVFYGYIGLVEGLIARIGAELETKPTVVATGGFAEMIFAETKSIDYVEPDLMLRGIARCARLL
jgi:type III pantothenate kinase